MYVSINLYQSSYLSIYNYLPIYHFICESVNLYLSSYLLSINLSIYIYFQYWAVKGLYKWTVSQNGPKFILEQRFTSQTPVIFACFFWGGGVHWYEIFHLNKKLLSYLPIFLLIYLGRWEYYSAKWRAWSWRSHYKWTICTRRYSQRDWIVLVVHLTNILLEQNI